MAEIPLVRGTDMDAEPTDTSLICLSTADWDAPLWTNKQHLMQRLAAAGNDVLYIDSLGLRTPSASAQDASRIVRRLKAWRPFARPVAERVLRDSPLVLPFHGNPAAARLNAKLLKARTRRNEARHGLERPVLWTYTPTAIQIHSPRRHSALVYHCVDDLAAYPGVDRDAFEANERALVQIADVCIASSRPLAAMLRERGAKRVLYWPNPADTRAYAAARAGQPHGRERPVIGFIGAVQEHKLDLDLVRACAELRPDWDWRLVGPVGLGIRDSAIDRDSFPGNVHFPGGLHRDDLPAAVAGFDAAVIPYRVNDYTISVFPMKVFEYLAAGLPVVSTPLPSLDGEVEHVEFASAPEKFVAALERGLNEDDASARSQRSLYAAAHSWEARTDEAVDLLSALRDGRPVDDPAPALAAHGGRT
jgi:glycosyltransferase involved in cell wall biosynthesis